MSAADQAAVAASAIGAGPSADELARLSLPELLAKLEPIAEPTPISYLPQTEIWLWLAAALALLLVAIAWRVRRRWKARAYRRAALAELRRADDIAAMAVILRRTALAAYPREEVAGLIGEEWLGFLDRTLDRTPDRTLDPKRDRTSAGTDDETSDGPTPTTSTEAEGGSAGFRSGLGRMLLVANYADDARVAATSGRSAELRALIERWVRQHRVDGKREAA